MIELHIPGRGEIQLEHLVCDVNGTLALDGRLLDEVPLRLARLGEQLTIHLVTADTHGKQSAIDAALGLTATRLHPGDEAAQKAAYVHQLGAAHTAAIGQGSNDAGMLAAAALGVCVLSPEGLSREALLAADLCVACIQDALDLFLQPLRITASLRK